LQAETVVVENHAFIDASGEEGGDDGVYYSSGGGGGSGGGILVVGVDVVVDGALSVAGGEGGHPFVSGYTGGGGGGGRIKIFYEDSLDVSTATIDVSGGDSGDDGTYYEEQVTYDDTPFEI
jgi:hypothetical protein